MAHPGEPVPVLWRRRHKSGEWLWLEGTAINLIDDPAIGGIVTNYRDVTQRKAAETRLQSQLAQLALLSQITTAIGERQDVPSIFQVAINTVEEQLPVDFACIGLYDADREFRHHHERGPAQPAACCQPRAHAELARQHRQERPFHVRAPGASYTSATSARCRFAFPQRLAGGGLRSMVAAPLLVESKVFGVLVTARDKADAFSSSECEFLRQLSEHVALAAHQANLYGHLQTAYDDLRLTQQAVMQQERLMALGQMASGIAHDINNAISPITLYTESLLETEPSLSPRARGYLETIQRAIDDVAHTVARMREFYRQRESQLTLASGGPERPRAAGGAADASTLERHGATARHCHRGAHGAGARAAHRAGNRERAARSAHQPHLQRRGCHAEGWAADGAHPHCPTKPARVGRTTLADSVLLEVVDSGVGMDEDTRRRCLEPFFTTKGERGTGLGLAMVYGSMQRHGAEIEIDSTPGEGTTFRLCFAIPPETPASALPVRTVQSSPSPLRVLLVDDDPLVLKSLRDTLEVDGHAVTVANGGQAGVDLFLAGASARQPVPGRDHRPRHAVRRRSQGVRHREGRAAGYACGHAHRLGPAHDR